MRFYDDMCSKFGFDDGDGQLPVHRAFRDVYQVAINRAAERLGSKIRVAKYDRPGMHNGCMVLLCHPEDLQPDGQISIKALMANDEVQADPQFEAALEICHNLDELDGLVGPVRPVKGWQDRVRAMVDDAVQEQEAPPFEAAVRTLAAVTTAKPTRGGKQNKPLTHKACRKKKKNQ